MLEACCLLRLQVSTQPGEVIKPDSWKVVDGEGMPIEGSPYEKGNLYIQFDVKFPDSLTPQQVSGLQQVSGARSRDLPLAVGCFVI